MELSMQFANTKPTIQFQNHKSVSLFSKRPKPIIISCQFGTMQSNKTNFYELLSLNSQNACFDDIKKAYKTMALQYHPDVCTQPLTKDECTKRFIELRQAYETLSDPISREIYDYELNLGDAFMGSGLGESRMEVCPRDVWERQLVGLKRRSCERLMRKEGV